MKKSVFFLIGFSFVLSACEEDTLSDDYYKEYAYQKKFEQEFGNIAPGHQWGFDVAEDMFSVYNELTRAIIKPDMNVGGTNLRPYQLFGKVPDITQKEHDEVLAWFTNHKVKWDNTPTAYEGTITRQTSDNTAHVIDTSYPDYGSLVNYSDNTLGDYVMNAELHFYHGWIQHVAKNDRTEEVIQKASGAADEQNFVNDPNYPDVPFMHNKANDMDYLRCWSLENNNWSEHILDFNAAQGWGWERQEGTGTMNAILLTYTDIDNWTYGCSDGSSLPHDKYYIVHLKGDDYEGWYLGMDFESWGDNTRSRIYADGICNDWIIKITDVGNMMSSVKVRIMCEDLGYTYDWDFNDIVYDVEFFSQNYCKITMQAAGGTMPIQLRYGNDVIVHNGNSEIHAIYGVGVKQPVNVAAGVTKAPIDFYIAFNNTQSDLGITFDLTLNEPSTEFSLSKINVYVKPDTDNEKAEWIEVDNKEGEAPYKFAVPITDNVVPKWLKEEKRITLGYPTFEQWINDPLVEFWKNPDETAGVLYP